jgi:hypothetical protein
MSVSDKFTSSIRNGKPGGSDSIEPNDLPYFGLARFDTRHITVHHIDSKIEQKKPYDPDGVLISQPMLECVFCDEYKTKIKFDLEIHLYEMHRWFLLKKLPFKGKGYSMDHRIEYVIDAIKTKGKRFEQLKSIQATAQAVATDIKKLIKSTTTMVDRPEPPDEIVDY